MNELGGVRIFGNMERVGGVYPYPPEKIGEILEKNFWKTWMFVVSLDAQRLTAAGHQGNEKLCHVYDTK